MVVDISETEREALDVVVVRPEIDAVGVVRPGDARVDGVEAVRVGGIRRLEDALAWSNR
jgi:hypothetical protein